MDDQLAVHPQMYSQADRDRNWRMFGHSQRRSSDVATLSCPAKVRKEAIRQLLDAGVLPSEDLEKISTAFGPFQPSAIAFPKTIFWSTPSYDYIRIARAVEEKRKTSNGESLP